MNIKFILLMGVFIALNACSDNKKVDVNVLEDKVELVPIRDTVVELPIEVAPSFDTLFLVYPIEFETVTIDTLMHLSFDHLEFDGKYTYHSSYVKIKSNHVGAETIKETLYKEYFGIQFKEYILNSMGFDIEFEFSKYFEEGVESNIINNVVGFEAAFGDSESSESERYSNQQYSLDTKVIYNKNNLITFQIDDYNYVGMAHGYSTLKYMTFNTKSGELLELFDCIKYKDYFMNKIREHLKRPQKRNGVIPKLYEDIDLTPKNFYFEDSVLFVTYQSGIIAPSIFGNIIIEIPMYVNSDVFGSQVKDMFHNKLPPERIINIGNKLDLLKYEFNNIQIVGYDSTFKDTSSVPLKAEVLEEWFAYTTFEDSTCHLPTELGRHFNDSACIMYDSKKNMVCDDIDNTLIGDFTPINNGKIYPLMSKEAVIHLLGKPYRIDGLNITYRYESKYLQEDYIPVWGQDYLLEGLTFVFSSENELIAVNYQPIESHIAWGDYKERMD